MTTMAMPAAEVETARVELRDTVDALTVVGHCKLERDDGTTTHTTTDPLLDQVADEAAGQSNRAGALSFRSRPPAYLEALQLLADVDSHTARHDGTTRVQRVRAWCNTAASSTPGAVVDARDTAERWLATTRNLLDPKPKLRLRGQSCPSCGVAKVWDREDAGADEHHARPSLEVDPHRGLCVCLNCNDSWNPGLWELLAQVLEQQRHETLAVDGWNPSVTARTPGEAGQRWFDQ